MTFYNQLSTTIPFYTALLIIWFDSVKAFFISQQQPMAALVRDIMTRTNTSPILQFRRKFHCNLPKILSSSMSLKNSFLSLNSLHLSSFLSCQTSLHMASYIGDLGGDRPLWTSSPFTSFKSWYSVLDPTLKSPVYNE